MVDALVSRVFNILIQRVHQAIVVAVAVDHDEISNLNLHVGFDSSQRKNTTLHIAARVGNKKMVEALFSEGTPASLLTENSKHETPLHIAARSGHVHVVKFLIYWATESIDVEPGGIQQVLRMRNMEGNTPLHEAVRNGHHSTVHVLVEANDSDLLVSLNNAKESPLFMAVDARASEIVKTILPKSNPYSLLHRSSEGQTILHRAILRADLNSCGRSPLHYAVASGALALVDHLLQLKPSNGSFLDNNLATPAHMAAKMGI
ncbi:Serine/threonine-protein phosphatase 6 regulatory ankyrin repeat subunit B [Vitis vinifera]|uniref:Serine/threonine-protein phosphatase 6 regulatory ankyrin repeat subunit B n=1 Tax=Vitis vinifera TaxID=29760 RepID=A0A438G606_VITVI|nr:Serine/threonine-protein phosphatase 6 regulatory ankyrin repeat subunit B [Vitis vinifera]